MAGTTHMPAEDAGQLRVLLHEGRGGCRVGGGLNGPYEPMDD